jgi:hypothetical protein
VGSDPSRSKGDGSRRHRTRWLDIPWRWQPIGNFLLADAEQLPLMGDTTSIRTRELRLQTAARRRGLKLISDSYSARTGRKRYFLRPTWDARQTVLGVADGGCALAQLSAGRRIADSLMSLDEIEELLKSLRGLMGNAPARLPWQAGVVAATSDRSHA